MSLSREERKNPDSHQRQISAFATRNVAMRLITEIRPAGKILFDWGDILNFFLGFV
ncbi:hypothetical protein [Nostoc sp. PA-18-2419]|uniref:hypothetical protein n=1 Tax=Nostoc sp. PA-18-2419 TaxID=2575443 RepID=UPI0016734A36|nr:hypothetical protein [Nostoc sp. PA-18-2419]